MMMPRRIHLSSPSTKFSSSSSYSSRSSLAIIVILPISVLLLFTLAAHHSLLLLSSGEYYADSSTNHNGARNVTYNYDILHAPIWKNADDIDIDNIQHAPYKYNNNKRMPELKSDHHVDHVHTNITIPPIDFAIIGFPKTGTTTLLQALNQHPEVNMPPTELCQIHQNHKSWENWVRKHNAHRIQSFLTKKNGIKCPAMIRLPSSTENLMKLSNNTRLVVGLRHPIRWFESFYNYRLWEHYHYNMTDMEIIPHPSELTNGGKHWRIVSTVLARYEEYLQQLDKVPLSSSEMNDMNSNNTRSFWSRRLVPNPYKIFIYIDEQLKDQNTNRRIQFQKDLQTFLGLRRPIIDFGSIMANANTERQRQQQTTTLSYEYIDICEVQYASIREELLQQATKTRHWLRDKFIPSEYVTISGRELFLSSLESWSDDPCMSE